MCVFDSTCIRFSASLVPSGRLSPWTHWTVLSLSHGSPPFSPSPKAFFFSQFLYLSQGLLRHVCVCLPMCGVHV